MTCRDQQLFFFLLASTAGSFLWLATPHAQTWRDKWINGQGRCVQGNHTEDTHRGDLGYAFDFKLRPGTKVGCFGPQVARFLWSASFFLFFFLRFFATKMFPVLSHPDDQLQRELVWAFSFFCIVLRQLAVAIPVPQTAVAVPHFDAICFLLCCTWESYYWSIILRYSYNI